MHVRNMFGAYLGNSASKGREISLQGLLANGSAEEVCEEDYG